MFIWQTEYYILAYGYGFYLLVFNSISHSFAALTREISSWPLEDKIHIHARACKILCLFQAVICTAKTARISTRSSEGLGLVRGKKHIYLAKSFRSVFVFAPCSLFLWILLLETKHKNSKQRNKQPRLKIVQNGKTICTSEIHITQGGYVAAPKQKNGGQVGVPHKSSGNWVLFICKLSPFFFFRLKNMAREWMLQNNIGSLLSACDDLEFAKTRARSSSTLTLSRNAERSVIQAWCDRSSLKSVYGKDF